jgi:cell division protein FtsW
MAVGLTFTMVVTAYLHIGVVIGLLPTTGLTLPFVSYGRSNLVLSMLLTGILVNIGSTRERVYNDGATDPLAYAPS